MRNDLIRAILNCGVDDLSILDDSEADMFKIIEQMRFEGLELSLNGIMTEIFKEGIFRMDEAVKSEKKRLETEEHEGTLTAARKRFTRKCLSRKCRTLWTIPGSILKGRCGGYGCLYGRWV